MQRRTIEDEAERRRYRHRGPTLRIKLALVGCGGRP
jgi:hypothetical protein